MKLNSSPSRACVVYTPPTLSTTHPWTACRTSYKSISVPLWPRQAKIPVEQGIPFLSLPKSPSLDTIHTQWGFTTVPDRPRNPLGFHAPASFHRAPVAGFLNLFQKCLCVLISVLFEVVNSLSGTFIPTKKRRALLCWLPVPACSL
jgi:hypothetical protein